MKLRSIFSRHLAFQPIDPMADGLAELIEEEQQEHAINLSDDEPDVHFWDDVDMHEA